ncbi:hypothetical protein GGTG_03034 [Gaeumannomyces tritici R3-111a-1]|uniref:Uncharacterized protein n=1 Tax=Gaeumannomyces tritici (strain R3-111a-1) TaxID=644352 RepID=J3NP28_GAET3|nr:hypothetical protein GGTG_03034 [Gaeumannomyces tritici R3-111a-1]EJT77931.1 hypothetical protein GGTG_03034 [Gaeumannomyces tritici R3-111a-1]
MHLHWVRPIRRFESGHRLRASGLLVLPDGEDGLEGVFVPTAPTKRPIKPGNARFSKEAGEFDFEFQAMYPASTSDGADSSPSADTHRHPTPIATASPRRPLLPHRVTAAEDLISPPLSLELSTPVFLFPRPRVNARAPAAQSPQTLPF